MGALRIFQGSPCFGTWPTLGLVRIEVSGGVLGSGRVWGDMETCLV